MEIRNGLITAYNGISASLGTSNQFNINKSGTNYLNVFNNGRLRIGSGTVVDAGYQADIVGTIRVQGPIYTTFGTSSLNIIANTATGAQTADRGILIGTSTFTASSAVSLAIGQGTTIGAGTGNIAIGFGTNANSAGIAIGGTNGIGATANGGIAIGGGVVSNGGIAIGGLTSNSAAVALGNTAQAVATNAIAIGLNVLASGSFSIAIGDRASIPANHGATIVLGLFARSTNSRQLIIGGNDVSNLYSINDVYIGGGVQDLNNGNATSVTINASGGGNATNTTGGNIRIAGGKGTGNAIPGDVIFATSVTGSSGTTLQTLTDRWYIKGNSGTLANRNISHTSSFAMDISGLVGITGSLIMTGSIFMSPSSSFVLPLTASSSPLTGSAYWSGSLLFIWNGTRYMSSSFA